MMTGEIQKELARLEVQHDIKILYAVESGSRAWGFASADSDWDVRFIYVHRHDWYLQIEEQRDTLGEILPNDIDLAGWDLKKALQLFRKSNPSLMEWVRSPIVYWRQGLFIDRLRGLEGQFFNPKACLYHYLHMAEGNYRNYLQGDTVRVKKYFYMLRPLLACDWIQQTNTMAPMEFQRLLETQVADGQVADEINKLLVRKKSGEELDEEPKIQILNDFVKQKIDHYNGSVKNLEQPPLPDAQPLNELLRLTIGEAWRQPRQ